MKKLFYLILLSFAIISCEKEEDPVNGGEEEYKVNWGAAADSSATRLLGSFWNGGEKYFNYDSNGKNDFHYWPQAHALDAVIDAYLRTGDNTYKNYMNQWFEGVKVKNGNTFDNHYYDDMEWIALALLRAYDATKDDKFKDAALQVWGYIKTGWSEQAGGGIVWNKERKTKNACSNGPACILAARLYQRFGNEEDKEWALKIYNWEKSVLFNANTGAVYDNIDIESGEIKRDWIFTYNQGTFIGSAVELHNILGERSYLNDAVRAANYTIGSLVNNSILKSEGTGDGGLFKGIFIRYFTDLIQQERLDTGDKRRYIQFMKYNAETLWLQGTAKPVVLFGPDWRNKPASVTGLTEQLSGSMLIEAMALLEKGKYLQ
ncbi:glycoside hydrolase family 76 protein [Proteiniphilum sp.]|uniref:glycoside hydrolase family 76 protein n=1 Tax=Proteiniphilum sp. TaxID=1926877 RepID=UPI002B2056FC|nr:glycoside hydrolase family 76 protein [Proteiniphilum sp.]MEA4919250.1 glycoside hydrolase family 76 protein [Proteiniphilum sp.]